MSLIFKEGSALSALSAVSKIVVDSADFASNSSLGLPLEFGSFNPVDATTNPTLILNAAQSDEHKSLVLSLVAQGDSNMEDVMDELNVAFGKKILNLIPGRVSVEVNAKYSFDTEKTVRKALRLIELFERDGFSRERILIKIAATWEGIEAARSLEKSHGIHCNLTLIFDFHQAVACGNAGVTLISPFVGRLMDWHLKDSAKSAYPPNEDPGVLFVKKVFSYFKMSGIQTQIMGASFRNTGEILALAGLDCITISPALLKELSQLPADLVGEVLSAERHAKQGAMQGEMQISKDTFHRLLSQNEAASELLSSGIDRFIQDTDKLEEHLKRMVATSPK